jgi:hypothetical protein
MGVGERENGRTEATKRSAHLTELVAASLVEFVRPVDGVRSDDSECSEFVSFTGNEAPFGRVLSVLYSQKGTFGMFEPVEVEARSDYRLWIRYSDGVEGKVDLSHLAGRGVFELWDDEQAWKDVRIAEDGAIQWTEEVELCPDATYLKLTGESPEEILSESDTATRA